MFRPLRMPKDTAKERPAGGFGAGLIERVDALKRPRNSVSKVANLHFRNYPALTTRQPHTQFAETGGPATGLYPFYETDVLSITRIGEITGAGSSIRAAAWSPDSRILAVAKNVSNRIDIYRREGLTLRLDEAAGISIGSFYVQSMEWSPDGDFLAVALQYTSSSGTTTAAKIYRLADGRLTLVNNLPVASRVIRDVSWSGSSDLLAVSDETNGRVLLFRRNRQNPSSTWPTHATLSLSSPWSVALSPDGTMLAASRSNNQTITVWRTANSTVMSLSGDVTGGFADLSWSADSMYLVAAARDRGGNQLGNLFLWQYNAVDDRLDDVALPDLAINRNAYVCSFAKGSQFLATVVDTKPDRVISENPVTQALASEIYDVGFGNTLFVAVGKDGYVASAPQSSMTWTNRVSNVNVDLLAIAYSGSLFVAVGREGAITTSNNGTAWTARTSGVSADLHGVAYGSSLFVAVGDNGTIITSTNGTSSWTERTSGTSENLVGVAYGDGIYVAVGGTTVLTSTDGADWVQQDPGLTDNELLDVVFKDGTFLAVGTGGTALVSTDGETWEPVDTGLTADLHAVAVGENYFIVAGSGGVYATSKDGETWDQHPPTDANVYGIAFGNSRFMLGGVQTVDTPPGFVVAVDIEDDPQPGRGILLRVDGSLVSVASMHVIDWAPQTLAWSYDEDLIMVPNLTGPMSIYYFDKQRRESLIVGAGPEVYRVTADGQSELLGTGMASDRPWSAASIGGRVILTDGENPVKAYNGLTFFDLPGDPPKEPVILAAYNRLFLAGENMVYVSDIDDIETWDSGDAGSISVGAGTGDTIQHLASDGPILIWMRSMLYQLRGPDLGYTLNDDGWVLNEVAPVGTVNGRTVVRSNFGWFWLSRTGIHVWTGGVSIPLISHDIEDVIVRINWPFIDTACAWVDRSERYHLSVPLDNATEPSHVIVFDPRSKTFTLYRDLPPYSFATTFSSPAFRDIGYEVPVMLGAGGGLFTEADNRRFETTDEALTELSWELEWGPDGLGTGAHESILRRVYVVLSMEPGATANLQTSVDEGQTWTSPDRLTANSHLTKIRRNLPLATGEVNKGASFMVRMFGTGIVTVHDIVPVGEALAD